MPAVRRPIPKISLNYDIMVAETLAEIGYRQLGMLIRGLCWSVEHSKPYVIRNIMALYADETDLETVQDDIDLLIKHGLLIPEPGKPKHLYLGEKSWMMLSLPRQRIPDRTRALVFERDGRRCRRCNSTDRLTIDHIHPHSRGGSNDAENLQTLCHPCNSSKGARVA